jgi:hypothetical protein
VGLLDGRGVVQVLDGLSDPGKGALWHVEVPLGHGGVGGADRVSEPVLNGFVDRQPPASVEDRSDPSGLAPGARVVLEPDLGLEAFVDRGQPVLQPSRLRVPEVHRLDPVEHSVVSSPLGRPSNMTCQRRRISLPVSLGLDSHSWRSRSGILPLYLPDSRGLP